MMADSSDQYESVLCVKPEVHVYRIPPRSSNRGYRKCVCTLMCVCSGELFAQAPVDQYPGIVVEAVTDSSRYFVIRIEDGNGRHAFIGIGFADRGDSFDFNVALQDHFKWVKQESELARQEAAQVSAPKLDLGFKEGQTIKINIGNIKKKDSGGAAAKSRPMGGSLLPPPPGVKSSALVPPPAAQQTTPASPPSPGMILEFGDPAPAVAPPSQDLWGDFTAAGSGSAQDSRSGWVQF
uniref:Adaptin ear-binding coat-associated protein 2-like n=1 Tax=Sinocyclocheilus anshuiensis TaxID=1608454 RepID=A0A671M3Z9_9TELE